MLERTVESVETVKSEQWADPASNAAKPGDASGVFSFKAAFLVLVRRKWLIAFCTFVCAAIAIAISALTPPTYSATSQLLFGESDVRALEGQEVFLEESLSNPLIESQMLVIRSPLVLAQVVDTLNLTDNQEFMQGRQTQAAVVLEQWIADGLALLGIETPEKVELAPDELRESAVRQLRANLSVTRSGLTRVVQVRFTSVSPELSAMVANSVVETFLSVRIENRVQSATRAAEWFDRRLAELNDRALEAERRLEQFRTNDTMGTVRDQSIETPLSELRLELQNAMSERVRAQGEVKAFTVALMGGRGLAGISDRYRTPEMEAFAETLIALTSEANRLRNEGASQEQIEGIEREIDRVEDVSSALIQDALRNAEDALARATGAEEVAQENFRNAQSDDATRVSGTQQSLIRQYENEAKVYRELQQSYFGSYVRTIQQQTFPSSGGTIIQTARAPDFPQGLGTKKVAILAALVGIVLGILISVGLENFDGSVRNRQHIQQITRRALLGLLPPVDKKKIYGSFPTSSVGVSAPKTSEQDGDLEVGLPAIEQNFSKLMPEGQLALREPMSAYSMSIRRARVEVEKVAKTMTGKVLFGRCITGFISENPSEGRSLAALNYAEVLAARGNRTLLVDLDWFNPKLTKSIAPKATKGVAEISSDREALKAEPVLFHDRASGLYFMPNRNVSSGKPLSGVALDSTRTVSFLTMISSHFDEIIIDLPAMETSVDWLAVAEICDGFILVADWGQTSRADLRERLQNADVTPSKLVGSLLNGVTEKEFASYAV